MNFFQLITEIMKEECESLSPSGSITNLDYTVVQSKVFDLVGPIAIQIEYFNVDDMMFSYKLDENIEKRVRFVMKEMREESIIRNAILITNLDETIIDSFKKSFAHIITSDIHIWGSRQINPLLEKHPHIFARYNREFFVSFIKEEFSRVITNPQHREDQIIYSNNYTKGKLKKEYKDGELVLFLGAGVSMSANLPSWTELVSKVYFEALLSKGISIEDIENDPQSYWQLTQRLGNNNLLVRTKYAKLLLEDNFISYVHKWLYNNSSRTSDLLKSISDVINKSDLNQRRLVSNVVTYNYDDLLESHLELCNIKYTSIWKDSQRVTPLSVGVYHVHGYLPYSNEFSSENIVFSEDEYHEQYMKPYEWSNVLQLNMFREKTCLFIGSTLSDPNTRRILDISRSSREGKQHFIIFPRLYKAQKIKEISNDKTLLEKLISTEDQDFESLVEKLRYLMIDKSVVDETLLAEELLVERDFNNLGLNVIWINDFNEIPLILNYLQE